VPGVTAVLAFSNSAIVGARSSNRSASALPGGVVCSVSVIVGYHIGLTYSVAASCDTLVTSTTYLRQFFARGLPQGWSCRCAWRLPNVSWLRWTGASGLRWIAFSIEAGQL
jgi:hypothetical protein